jgi:transposase
VVFEATGGYERPLFDHLHAHGAPCVIRQLVAGHASLQAPAKLLLSIKGVGGITAWTILAYLHEITFSHVP